MISFLRRLFRRNKYVGEFRTHDRFLVFNEELSRRAKIQLKREWLKLWAGIDCSKPDVYEVTVDVNNNRCMARKVSL